MISKMILSNVLHRPLDTRAQRLARADPRLRSPNAQGATLFVLLQPSPFSTRFVPLFTAVLLVTLEGQDTESPTLAPVTVLPITVLP